MTTIYLYDRHTYIFGLLLIAVLIVFLAVAFCRSIIASLKRGDWRDMGVVLRIVRYVIPGVFLLVVIAGLLVAEVNLGACLYQWDQGEFQLAEGEISQLDILEDTRRGDTETIYKCSFIINGIQFPLRTNRYTEETVQLLSNAEIVRVYYLLDRGDP